jgi:hypothetical protein
MAEISSSGELRDGPDIRSLSIPKRKKSLGINLDCQLEQGFDGLLLQ